MIALDVVVGQVLRESSSKRFVPKENHPTQAFVLNGSDESFGERIQIWRSGWKANHLDSFPDEDVPKFFGILGVSIQDQVPLVAKEVLLHGGDVARHLGHPTIVGVGRNSSNMNRARRDVDEEQDIVCD